MRLAIGPIVLRAHEAVGLNDKEETTHGAHLSLQVWRVVFEWWVTWR